jgi:hypothetical protein
MYYNSKRGSSTLQDHLRHAPPPCTSLQACAALALQIKTACMQMAGDMHPTCAAAATDTRWNAWGPSLPRCMLAREHQMMSEPYGHDALMCDSRQQQWLHCCQEIAYPGMPCMPCSTTQHDSGKKREDQQTMRKLLPGCWVKTPDWLWG